MIPMGALLQWNTHIPGRILEVASEDGTSTHVSLLSSCVTSLWALFFILQCLDLRELDHK